MSEFNEDEFQDFLSSNTQSEEAGECIALATLRAQQFLIERGERLVPDGGFAQEWFDDEQQFTNRFDEEKTLKEVASGRELSEAEIEELSESLLQMAQQGVNDRCAVMVNSARLISFAAIVSGTNYLYYRRGEEVPIEVFTKLKKDLQAQYRIEGASQVWHELVDSEIPGEPLGEGDEDLVYEIALRSFGDHVEVERTLGETQELIKKILTEEGVSELDFDEQTAVISLALSHSFAMLGDGNANWQEEAQVTLLNYGIGINSAWAKVIAQLSP